jgi:hypothetical protein
MGNPQARRLVEYMSYTCPHCAHFEAESALALRNGPIASGKGSFEVRHLLRDPIDATIAAADQLRAANALLRCMTVSGRTDQVVGHCPEADRGTDEALERRPHAAADARHRLGSAFL